MQPNDFRAFCDLAGIKRGEDKRALNLTNESAYLAVLMPTTPSPRESGSTCVALVEESG